MYGAVNWTQCTIFMSNQSLKISASYRFAFWRYSQKGEKVEKLDPRTPHAERKELRSWNLVRMSVHLFLTMPENFSFIAIAIPEKLKNFTFSDWTRDYCGREFFSLILYCVIHQRARIEPLFLLVCLLSHKNAPFKSYGPKTVKTRTF